MKKENHFDSTIAVLEEKLREGKVKLLNLRSDLASRKLKNMKELNTTKKEIARVLHALESKRKEDVKKVTEGKK